MAKKTKTKAQQWAEKTPTERVKLYRDMAFHLRDVGAALGEAAAPGEVVSLGLTARRFNTTASRVQHELDRKTQPECCSRSRVFGDCDCAERKLAEEVGT